MTNEQNEAMALRVVCQSTMPKHNFSGVEVWSAEFQLANAACETNAGLFAGNGQCSLKIHGLNESPFMAGAEYVLHVEAVDGLVGKSKRGDYECRRGGQWRPRKEDAPNRHKAPLERHGPPPRVDPFPEFLPNQGGPGESSADYAEDAAQEAADTKPRPSVAPCDDLADEDAEGDFGLTDYQYHEEAAQRAGVA